MTDAERSRDTRSRRQRDQRMLLRLLAEALGHVRPGTGYAPHPRMVSEALREARRIHPGVAANVEARLAALMR